MGDPVLVHDLLEEGAARHPDKVAVVHRGEELGYAELDRLAEALAAELRNLGVEEGDRVALLLESSHEFVIAFFGVLKAGAAVVPIDLPIVARELLHHLDDCTPKVLLTDRKRHDLARAALEESVRPPTLAVVERSALAGAAGRSPSARPSPEAMACLLYTSGTTGEPKGVMLSHGNLLANVESIVGYLPLEPDDRTMLVLPLTHSYGLSVLTTRLRVGGTVLVDNRFAFPNVVLEAMRQQGATAFAGVPSHYAMLLRKSALRKTELPTLRYVTQAGGPLPPAMIGEFLDALPQVQFYVMYGQTEASARLSYLEPGRLMEKMGSIGRGIPGVELEVWDESGCPVKPGETGEIVA
ncbi:MAG TPA: AMP-binding protein, partial [Longimicrobiales bacterium]|nr:AMP-binding protein [Longimicrobiales bacterium]